VTISLTLKTLTTFDVPTRFTYHRFALKVSSGVSVCRLGCSPTLEMTLRSEENLRKVLCLELTDLPAQGSLFCESE